MLITQKMAPARQHAETSFIARMRKTTGGVIAVSALALAIFTTPIANSLGTVVAEVIGILLLAAGVLGRIWSSIYIAGHKNSQLCEDGPYSLCRNPLYLFSYLAVIGLALSARLGVVATAITPLFWIYHHFVVRSEEANLLKIFGERYVRYAESVPRFLPRFQRYWSRQTLETNPRVLGRNLLEVAWFLVALALLEIVEHARGIDPKGPSLPTLAELPF